MVNSPYFLGGGGIGGVSLGSHDFVSGAPPQNASHPIDGSRVT